MKTKIWKMTGTMAIPGKMRIWLRRMWIVLSAPRTPGEEYDCLYASALCRQRADWLVGINGTRIFTVLYGNRV